MPEKRDCAKISFVRGTRDQNYRIQILNPKPYWGTKISGPGNRVRLLCQTHTVLLALWFRLCHASNLIAFVSSWLVRTSTSSGSYGRPKSEEVMAACIPDLWVIYVCMTGVAVSNFATARWAVLTEIGNWYWGVGTCTWRREQRTVTYEWRNMRLDRKGNGCVPMTWKVGVNKWNKHGYVDVNMECAW